MTQRQLSISSSMASAHSQPSSPKPSSPGASAELGYVVRGGQKKLTQRQLSSSLSMKRVAPMEVSAEAGNAAAADWLDDDGRPRRRGTLWTASSHIVTAVIGSGVLSLAWAIAQLGWVAGPAAMLLFALVTYYTATLLAECYRTGDPDTGKRNYTYMDAVRSNLGGAKVVFCGVIQYANLVGVAIGYTIASSISMQAIRRAGCFHKNGHGDPCKSSSNPYMILFGIVQILFSQIPDFDQIWWLSIVAAVMSFTYSSIGLALGIAQTICKIFDSIRFGFCTR